VTNAIGCVDGEIGERGSGSAFGDGAHVTLRDEVECRSCALLRVDQLSSQVRL